MVIALSWITDLHGVGWVKGTVKAKNNQIKKKIAANEVSTCGGWSCKILQLCAVCKGGLRGVEGY